MTYAKYSTKANAKRAAKNALKNHAADYVSAAEIKAIENPDQAGEWIGHIDFPLMTSKEFNGSQMDGLFSFCVTFAKPKQSNSMKYYKHERSAIGSACSMVHEIADSMPDASRKEVIEACREAGIAYGTARTQYQKWRKLSGK